MPEVEVRGRGMMVGIDLGDDPALRLGQRVVAEARARGAIVRPLGDVVVLMPAGDLARRPGPPGSDRGRGDRSGGRVRAWRRCRATSRRPAKLAA